MAETNTTGTKTFTSAESMEKGVWVRMGSGTVEIGQVTEIPIGVSTHAVITAGDPVAVDLMSKSGTLKCQAAGAITAGALVYGRNSGEIDDDSANSALILGVALPQPGQTTVAASAQGDMVEFIPMSPSIA
jgi:hypothetical protein